MKLPPGFSIEPGTSRLIYPSATGSPVAMPDPQQLAGNIWVFDPEAASIALKNNGLLGDNQPPLNKMTIVFRVRAVCGAVANAKFIYGAEAVQPCGISSNRLRRPGQPIGINGVNSANMSQPFLSFVNPNVATSCSSVVELSASILLEGSPTSSDSIYVILPVGTSFVANSYVPVSNAPGSQPLVKGQQLLWAFPGGLASNAVINFTFKIRYDEPLGCFDQFVIIQTREKSQAFCGSQACDVFVATGEHLLQLGAQNPDLQLTNFQLQTLANGQLTFTANLDNPGQAPATDPVVQIYHDVNGNGQVDASDTKLAEVKYTGTVTPGSTVAIGGNLSLPPSAYCDLLAFIPAELNCACDDVLIPLNGNQVVNKNFGFCNVQSVSLGTDLVQGNTYTWQTQDGITCTTPDCNNATYTPGPEVKNGDLVTLVLIEKAGNCTIERRFNIQFGAPPEETVAETVCAGSSVQLTAPDGGSNYQWTGPGINNASQQNQIVTPAASATYTVVVTFTGGCMGTKTTNVTVNPTKTKSIAMTTCSGETVTIFEDDPIFETDQPGVYSRTYSTFLGCDSVVTVTLTVPMSISTEFITKCVGDSIVFNGQTIKTNGMYCQTDIPSSSGCDSTHCIEATFAPLPDVPAQDSVIAQLKEPLTLDGPSGFNDYTWTPVQDECVVPSCEDVIVTPDSTTNFQLIVKDANNCADTVIYRVVTCDVKNLLDNRMPNAFTPNGDGSNDIFRPAPLEGAEMIVSLEIYDRWGTKVYEGFGPNATWDGRIKDKPATSDVYVYVIKAECNGFKHHRSGQITLLR